ncbi:MAG: hypothetical protein V3V97_04125 [Hyphomicrobiaceae bacterium]
MTNSHPTHTPYAKIQNNFAKTNPKLLCSSFAKSPKHKLLQHVAGIDQHTSQPTTNQDNFVAEFPHPAQIWAPTIKIGAIARFAGLQETATNVKLFILNARHLVWF